MEAVPRRAFIGLVAFAWACGDDAMQDGGSGDAGPPDGAIAFSPAPPSPPMPPALPAAPRLVDWTCATGFVATSLDEVTVCSPYAGARRDCPAGQAHFPGTTECAAIDPAPCAMPDGDVYVRAGATPPFEGTRSAPFASLNDAIATAMPGDVIAVAEGSYEGQIAIDRGVTIVGACAERTRIVRSSAGEASTVARTGTIALRRMAIASLRTEGDAHVTLENVVFEPANFGLTLRDASVVEGHDVLVRGSADVVMQGVVVRDGAQATLSRIAIVGTTEIGFGAAEEAQLTVSDALIAEMRAPVVAAAGAAVLARGTSHVSLSRVAIDDAVAHGVHVEDDAVAELADVGIRGLAYRDGSGDALRVEHGRIVAARVLVSDVSDFAVLCDLGGAIELTDVAIDGVSNGGGGGIGAINGGRVTVERAVVSEFPIAGTYAMGGGRLSLRDIVVRDGRGGDPLFAHASVLITQGASATVERARIDAFGAAMRARAADTTVDASDITVVPSATVPAGVGIHGRALLAIDDASLHVTRVHIEGHTEAAAVITNAHAEIEDVTVIDTAPDVRPAFSGVGGIVYQQHATGAVRRAVLRGARQVGVGVQDESEVALEDVAIIETRSPENAYSDGRSLQIAAGARVTLDRARIDTPWGIGIQVFGNGSLDARDVVLAGAESPRDRQARGIQLAGEGRVSIDRLEVSRCDGFGAGAYDATMTLRDVLVHATRDECPDEECATRRAGFGVGAYGNATVELERFVIDGSALCGANLADRASLRLRRGRVVMNPIGVCASSMLVPEELAEDVVFTNEQNLVATQLPVPTPAANTGVNIE